MKTNGFSCAVKDAIRNMPVHFANDRDRDDYIITHADRFATLYRTSKTNIKEEWSDIESARKAARFVVNVVDKLKKVPAGIVIYAMLGEYEAYVEVHHAKSIKIGDAVRIGRIVT